VPRATSWNSTGWTSPQMLRRYGASARSARARRSYDRVMEEHHSHADEGKLRVG
jgi:hypothetical protein